jgi:hypothetical protein
MALPLTTENLRSVERILKNAHRAVSQAILTSTGAVVPTNANYLKRKSLISNVAIVRFLISLANKPQGAAAIIAYLISDYIE